MLTLHVTRVTERRSTRVMGRPLAPAIAGSVAATLYTVRKRHRSTVVTAMAHTPKLRYVDPHARRGRLYLALCRFSATKAGAWLSVNISWKVDPHLLKLTRGRFSTAGPLATALLESRGARTGQPRRNATLYFHDGDRVTIIASKRGAPKHPAWYYNLREHPDVVFGGLPFLAEIVEDEAERQRLWDLADRVFPEYADYREQAGKAGRIIPIIQLVPR
jgi:deazaflavin-dependent nitroreductase family protein